MAGEDWEGGLTGRPKEREKERWKLEGPEQRWRVLVQVLGAEAGDTT